jgi:RNA polymerase sigma factor (sigma-70 family)
MEPLKRYEENEGLCFFVINNVLYGSAARASKVAKDNGMELQDFDQIAKMTLWNCCNSFAGPDKAFSSYAVKSIKFAVLDAIRRKSSIIKYGDDIKERAGIVSMELPITEDGSPLQEILGDGVDLEKRVVMKITLEERLSVLSENERNVIVSKIYGVSESAIIQKFGYTKPRIDYYKRMALKKLGIDPRQRKIG